MSTKWINVGANTILSTSREWSDCRMSSMSRATTFGCTKRTNLTSRRSSTSRRNCKRARKRSNKMRSETKLSSKGIRWSTSATKPRSTRLSSKSSESWSSRTRASYRLNRIALRCSKRWMLRLRKSRVMRSRIQNPQCVTISSKESSKLSYKIKNFSASFWLKWFSIFREQKVHMNRELGTLKEALNDYVNDNFNQMKQG